MAVHALKATAAMRSYLLDKPLEQHTDNASLLWLSHVSDSKAS